MEFCCWLRKSCENLHNKWSSNTFWIKENHTEKQTNIHRVAVILGIFPPKSFRPSLGTATIYLTETYPGLWIERPSVFDIRALTFNQVFRGKRVICANFSSIQCGLFTAEVTFSFCRCAVWAQQGPDPCQRFQGTQEHKQIATVQILKLVLFLKWISLESACISTWLLGTTVFPVTAQTVCIENLHLTLLWLSSPQATWTRPDKGTNSIFRVRL